MALGGPRRQDGAVLLLHGGHRRVRVARGGEQGRRRRRARLPRPARARGVPHQARGG